MAKVKKVRFEVEYTYPVDLPDEVILDRFAGQIINDASEITSEDIEIVEDDEQ